MDPNRTLVVYYSRTGATRDLARAVRDELGCELERIADHTRRDGLLGYLRSGLDAVLHRSTELYPMAHAASDYDLVVVGTPVWNASVSAPVRAYLEANRDHIRNVAFFGTCGGRGSGRAFRQMEAICGQSPLATLTATTAEVRRGDLAAKLRAFASALRSRPLSGRAAGAAGLRPVPA